MRLPGRIPAGSVFGGPVSSLDLAPTLLALAGLGPDVAFDGIDLMPHLAAVEALPELPLYWRTGNRAALRLGRWKIVRSPAKGAAGDRQLYDLEGDIAESRNLAATEPGILGCLVAEWDRLDAG